MAHLVDHLEDPLLRHETLDLVTGDDVAFLQRLDGEVLARPPVLGQQHLPTRRERSDRRNTGRFKTHVTTGNI